MSLFPPTSEAEQDALRDEREPQARGLRRLLPFLSKSMTASIAPQPSFKSCADWPAECCPAIGNHSEDTHYSKAEAEGVCQLLHENGFGGDRVFFPLRTWVEPIETALLKFPVNREEWLTSHERGMSNIQRAIKDASESALRQTNRATVLICDAEGLLKSGGNACARIRLQQAKERIEAAMSCLPET